jgi:hypothetical protein
VSHIIDEVIFDFGKLLLPDDNPNSIDETKNDYQDKND